jgi:hypothetical protein
VPDKYEEVTQRREGNADADAFDEGYQESRRRPGYAGNHGSKGDSEGSDYEADDL